MSLRTRLSLSFIVLVVVPLAGASVAVGVLVPREINERISERLHGAADAVASIRSERLDRAAREVARFARALAPLAPATRAARVAAARAESGLDFVRVGSYVAQRRPQFEGGYVPSTDPRAGAAGVIAASARLPDGTTVAGGWFTDQTWARRLAAAGGSGVAVYAGSRRLAYVPVPPSSATASDTSPQRPAAQVRSLSLKPDARSERTVLATHAYTPDGRLSGALGGAAGAAVLVACVLGIVLARSMAGPIRRLSAQAGAIAAGDYSHRVDVRGGGEVAQLGRSINSMSESVHAYVEELRASRDELRGTLERLGATLRSTRGMEEMLVSVLEAAAATLGADAGVLFKVEPGGTLDVQATIGFEAAQATREVAASAMRSRLPALMPGLGGDDPLGRMVAAAPLQRGDDIVGVLAIASGAVPASFDDHDLSMLASFAAQASVAIDNVFLREEAERLALTDSLTCVPNRRAMERLLQAEIERSQRYERPLSVLMLDIDHFKDVNDRYGHLVGDRVLVEIARRVGQSIRSGVDVLARYGGEEFVLMLAETPPSGAMTVARKILDAVSAKPFVAAGGSTITVSIGVATMPGDGPGMSDLLHTADLALYQAKEHGRNRAVPSATVAKEALSA